MIRDTHSKALIETDIVELQKYRKEKRRDKEMSDLKTEIRSLKECINSIVKKLEKIEAKRE
jgi:hypothetical protein